MKHTVTFEPGTIVVTDVPHGETLLRAAARGDVFVPSPCAGGGSCGRCLIRIIAGIITAEPTAKITAEQWERGVRLACTSRVTADVVVEVLADTQVWSMEEDMIAAGGQRPRRHLLEAQDATVFGLGSDIAPAARKVVVTLPPPSGADRSSDLARFRSALHRDLGAVLLDIPLRVIRELPGILRRGDWTVTAVIHAVNGGWRVGRVVPGVDQTPLYLAAIDLGTTTVWGELLEADIGRVVDVAAAFNQQIQFGEDVVSRMLRAGEPGGRERLQQAAVAGINEVLDQLAGAAGIGGEQVDGVVLAGNTTMTSLLSGIDARYLRLEPYVPPVDELPSLEAQDVGPGLRCAPGAVMRLLPVIASYVGGDIVAGVLASGMAEQDDVWLYLDVGTNGEVVVGNREWLLTTSCSAGPAFEGGGLRNGMRAMAGAVETVAIDRQGYAVSVLTIDDRPPMGICGSGVIDAVAELLRTGILLPNGRFAMDNGAAGLRRDADGRPEFVIVPAEFSGTGEDIVLTEADVDNVIRAKAAMFAGVTTLLKVVDLDWSDIGRIVVAGSFGRHLRAEEAMTIGLFPEFDPGKLAFLGNGSLLGARLVALSERMETRAREIAALMSNVELSDNTVFQEEYMAALFLPHTDLVRFPAADRMLSAQRRKA
ncbi:MAG: ASKHA domain-containing protein [Thermoleophilia bacterium]